MMRPHGLLHPTRLGALTGTLLVAQGLPPVPAQSGAPLRPPELLLPVFLPEEAPFGTQARPFRGRKVIQHWEGTGAAMRVRWELEGGVLEDDGAVILADHILYRPDTGEVEATGQVRMEGPEVRLRCARLVVDWKRKEGRAEQVVLEVSPEWTLESREVRFSTAEPRPGETLRVPRFNHWFFDEVRVTACGPGQGGWGITCRKMNLDLNGYAVMRGTGGWIGPLGLPGFMPWLAYPVTDRRPGLLMMSFSLASPTGKVLGLPYYQPLGPSADMTLSPEFHQKAGVLWGGELRWNPDTAHQGSFTGQYIRERMEGHRRRYRVALKELWQREDGWTLGMDLNHASDTLLDLDYGKGMGALGANAFDSSLFLGRTFGLGSVALTAGDRRTFFQAEDPLYRPDYPTSFRRQALPSAQMRFHPVPLGEFYFDGGARVGTLNYRIQLGDDEPTGSYRWRRADAFARMHGRLGQWGPLRADLQAMARHTRYGASLRDPFFSLDAGTTGFQGQALSPFRVDGPAMNRSMSSLRLKVAAPQLGRTFKDVSLLGYAGDVKHVLEPFLALTANSRFGRAPLVPRFDEVDARPGVEGTAMGEQSAELGLRQHVLGRSGAGQSFADLVRMRTSVRFHVQPVLLPDGRTQKKGWGSLDNELDVEPDERIRLSFRRSSEVGESGADNALSAEWNLGDAGRYSLAAYSTGINRFLVRQRGVQLGALHRLLEDRWRLEYRANYDFRLRRIAAAEGALTWMTDCVAGTVRVTRVVLPPEAQVQTGGTGRKPQENRLEFSLSLKGLGRVPLFSR